VFKGLMCWA